MNTSILVELNKKKYEELCEKEYIPIYNKPWFMDAVCGATENWEALVCTKDDKILGALPIYIKKKAGMNYITLPIFAQYNGVWIKPYDNQSNTAKITFENEIMTAMIEKLEEIVHKRGIKFYKQAFSMDITNWLPFYWAGFKQTTAYTYRFDNIADVQKIQENFSRNKRRNVKRAQAANLKVKMDLSAEEFYEFYKTCLAERGKEIDYSYSVFERIYNALYEHDAGKILYAVDEKNIIIDAIFSVSDERWGYNWWHAISQRSREVGASDYMLVEMLKYFSANGLQGYDMEGSMTKGVEESFRQYGTVQVPFFSISKIYTKNPFIKLLVKKHYDI